MVKRTLGVLIALVVAWNLAGCGDDEPTNPSNEAPVAVAGVDQTVKVGQTVVLNASGSSDPDGDALAFAWAFGSVPAGSGAAITGDTSAMATFVPDLEGAYQVLLGVSDGTAGASDTLTVTAVAPLLYAVVSNGDGTGDLHRLDPLDGSLISSIPINVPGYTVDAGSALARNPVDGLLYAALKLTPIVARGVEPRNLCAIDPTTGDAERIGGFSGESIAGLAFLPDGTLYAISGDGSTTSETLFKVSLVDGSADSVMTRGLGDDGESLAYNPVDGLLYHGSGHTGDCTGSTPADDGVCWESIDPVTLNTTFIDISGTDLTNEEVQALTYWEEEDVFLWTLNHDSVQEFYHVTADGTPSAMLGETSVQTKGLAFWYPGLTSPFRSLPSRHR